MKTWAHALLCLAATACSGPEPRAVLPAAANEAAGTVYLVAHEWHAGLVVPREAIPDGVWPEREDFPTAHFLEVGWGDGDYYRTPEPHLGITLKAALLPTHSVLHIVGFNGTVATYFPHSEIIAIPLSRAGLAALAEYVAASYARDAGGRSIPMGPGRYGDSRFYASHETYHLFNNCNAWTGRALQLAGCQVRSDSILRVETLLRRARACGYPVQ